MVLMSTGDQKGLPEISHQVRSSFSVWGMAFSYRTFKKMGKMDEGGGRRYRLPVKRINHGNKRYSIGTQ